MLEVSCNVLFMYSLWAGAHALGGNLIGKVLWTRNLHYLQPFCLPCLGKFWSPFRQNTSNARRYIWPLSGFLLGVHSHISCLLCASTTPPSILSQLESREVLPRLSIAPTASSPERDESGFSVHKNDTRCQS